MRICDLFTKYYLVNKLKCLDSLLNKILKNSFLERALSNWLILFKQWPMPLQVSLNLTKSRRTTSPHPFALALSSTRHIYSLSISISVLKREEEVLVSGWCTCLLGWFALVSAPYSRSACSSSARWPCWRPPTAWPSSPWPFPALRWSAVGLGRLRLSYAARSSVPSPGSSWLGRVASAHRASPPRPPRCGAVRSWAPARTAPGECSRPCSRNLERDQAANWTVVGADLLLPHLEGLGSEGLFIC